MPTSRTIKRYKYIGVMRQVNMENIKVFICPPVNKSIYIHWSDEISEYGKYKSIYMPTFK